MNGEGAGLLGVYRELEAMHGGREWHWWPDAEPFEVCVGAILVQNTAWANVERALALLRGAGALEPGTMARLEDAELEALVRPSGQYRQKARKLRAFLALIEEQGGLEGLLGLPAAELRGVLLGTWGIGEETADCVLVYAAKQPAFVVDAYTKRLFGRLGMGPGEGAGYGAWQRYVVEGVEDEGGPPARAVEFWGRFHALVVLHSKFVCRKRAPGCEGCALPPGCRWGREAAGEAHVE